MVVRFSPRFPAPARALVEQVLRDWETPLDLIEYEFQVNLRGPADADAEVLVNRAQRQVELRLRRGRLVPECLRPDLEHELIHVPLWETWEGFQAVLEFVPSRQRQRAIRLALNAFEAGHNQMLDVLRRMRNGMVPHR